MIRAIIFDCFGVLVTEGWLPYAEKYFGHDKARKRQASDLMSAVDHGIISYEEFIRQVADLAGVDKVVAHEQIMRNAPNGLLFAYIRDVLAPKYRIGILSNVGANRLSELFEPGQLALIDEKVLSYESGFVKPQAGAYESIAKKLGVAPDECIFVDDQEKHCVGARAVGMHAILYRDFAQAKREIEQIVNA